MQNIRKLPRRAPNIGPKIGPTPQYLKLNQGFLLLSMGTKSTHLHGCRQEWLY
jgi:hypothetical protein